MRRVFIISILTLSCALCSAYAGQPQQTQVNIINKTSNEAISATELSNNQTIKITNEQSISLQKKVSQIAIQIKKNDGFICIVYPELISSYDHQTELIVNNQKDDTTMSPILQINPDNGTHKYLAIGNGPRIGSCVKY